VQLGCAQAIVDHAARLRVVLRHNARKYLTTQRVARIIFQHHRKTGSMETADLLHDFRILQNPVAKQPHSCTLLLQNNFNICTALLYKSADTNSTRQRTLCQISVKIML
jgi:hypothetical protein